MLMTVGSSAMYVVSVVLPAAQAEFGVARADASLPYTLLMVGFGLGGLLMGRLVDRIGVMPVLWIGAVGLGLGFTLAAHAQDIVAFAIVHGLLLGLLGSSTTFAPLVADTALWFVRRRGIAVAICASGNYVAGAVWPPIVQAGISNWGWRDTYTALGLLCTVTMVLLSLAMRPRPPAAAAAPARAGAPVASKRPFGMSMNAATAWLCLAGVACCVAMAMPQVHIVAYCTDLGFGAARGAQMLSLMLATGIVSRLVMGAVCDRIGGLRTLLLGSALLRDHRARALPGRRRRRAHRRRADVHASRHGAGRLDVGQGVRPHRLVRRRIRQRHRVERTEPGDRRLAPVAGARRTGAGAAGPRLSALRYTHSRDECAEASGVRLRQVRRLPTCQGSEDS